MADVHTLPTFDAAREVAAPAVRVPIPADIDVLVRDDPETALTWRLRVREALVAAFAQGYAATGFRRADVPGGDAALILTHGSEGAV